MWGHFQISCPRLPGASLGCRVGRCGHLVSGSGSCTISELVMTILWTWCDLVLNFDSFYYYWFLFDFICPPVKVYHPDHGHHKPESTFRSKILKNILKVLFVRCLWFRQLCTASAKENINFTNPFVKSSFSCAQNLDFVLHIKNPQVPSSLKKKKWLYTHRKSIPPFIHPSTSRLPAVIYRCTPGAHDITTGRGYMCYKAHSWPHQSGVLHVVKDEGGLKLSTGDNSEKLLFQPFVKLLFKVCLNWGFQESESLKINTTISI